MEQARFEQGIEQLRKIDGVGGENVIKSLEDIAPDVGKYIIEFAFGDIFKSGNHTQSCAFATAGWTNQNDKLAIVYVKIEIENSLNLVIVDFVQVL